MSELQSLKNDTQHAQTSDRVLGALSDGVSGAAVFVIVIVLLIQIAGRLLDSPLAWTEELARAAFIWMVFAGVAASVRHADAARVTVLLRYFPGFVRKLATPIYAACNIAFFALTIWTGWYLVKQQVVMHESIATLGWPSWVIGVVLPASAVLSLLGLLRSLQTHRDIIAVKEDAS